MTSRRSFLFGLGAALAAPSIVRADSLMRILAPKPEIIIPYLEPVLDWVPCDGRVLHRALYSELFDVIGTVFGSGDQEGMFKMPDFEVPQHLQARRFPTDAPVPIAQSIRAKPSDRFPIGSVVQALGWPS